MASFIDASGDLVLDVVLTDSGRRDLARGDGSFKVVRWAAFDDEIDYSTFDKTHASGSAYYDLTIMQTPILEAFTNNAASCRSKLITMAKTDLLYFPVMKLNTLKTSCKKVSNLDGFVITVGATTEEETFKDKVVDGVLYGYGTNAARIRIDQGLDTEEISPSLTKYLADLRESGYIVEIDNRLGMITDVNGVPAKLSYVDDDNIASYYLTDNDTSFVGDINNTSVSAEEIIRGPRGTYLEFKVKASIDLNTNNYLFNLIGNNGTFDIGTLQGESFYYIDTIITVSGISTGASVDIPVRFVKT